MKNLRVRQDERKKGMTLEIDRSVSLTSNPAPVCMFCSTRYRRRSKNIKIGRSSRSTCGRMATNKLGMCKKDKDRLHRPNLKKC